MKKRLLWGVSIILFTTGATWHMSASADRGKEHWLTDYFETVEGINQWLKEKSLSVKRSLLEEKEQTIKNKADRLTQLSKRVSSKNKKEINQYLQSYYVRLQESKENLEGDVLKAYEVRKKSEIHTEIKEDVTSSLQTWLYD
ncbi:hypothetical protein GT022_08455 [Agaribacter marinus]|uniref:Uncharacterized protein n=1 Tax=Virgibacillus salarius TaxID=447199 RepID=A0A941DVF8_9BACI|nr:hypothetical protein [Virgibacillus salarius]MBR7796077.1 hypothetical protein [Virgibacillus salarius]NAZ08788.1 hypothetical protein [Agaribacter marinus]